MSNKKEVAKVKGADLALAGIDESMLLEDADLDKQGMTADDYAIPRLSILQSMSPQLQKQKPEYIKEAEQGEIIDSVTQQRFDGEEGVRLVPTEYRRVYIEWIPREAGGGFVADHGSDASILSKCTRDDRGGYNLPNGNQIVETAEYYCLRIAVDGSTYPVVISMTSSQLKKARKWNTIMDQVKVTLSDGRKVTPPRFAYSYTVTSVPESNDKGSWWGWAVERGEAVDADTYASARSLREAVRSGEAKASAPVEESTAVEGEDDPM